MAQHLIPRPTSTDCIRIIQGKGWGGGEISSLLSFPRFISSAAIRAYVGVVNRLLDREDASPYPESLAHFSGAGTRIAEFQMCN